MGIKTQSGSSLVEVMVGLFILAIGLLGILAMQAKSIQFNQSAYSYSQVVYLANNMAEQIQMNPDNITLFEGTPENSKDCSNAQCTLAELASWETEKWRNEVETFLPQGQASVEKLADQDYVLITVSFDDSRADKREIGESYADDEGNNATFTGRKEYKLLVGI